MTFQKDAASLLAGTGLAPGSQVPGLIGDEGDAAFTPASGSLPYHDLILSSAYIPGNYTPQNRCSACGHYWQMTLYTAPSGGHVFDAGTLQFAWGLDDEAWTQAQHRFSSAGFQNFVKKLLAELLQTPEAHAR